LIYNPNVYKFIQPVKEMRAVIQRVTTAKVVIDDIVRAEIQHGFLVFLGIETEDTQNDAKWLADKIKHMRIMNDEEGKMNLTLSDINGDVLVVSQFTLHASTKKGNRPSYIGAARPDKAIPLYNFFNEQLEVLTGKEIATGIFGADMKVSLTNDGPVTIIIDSRNRE